MNDFRDELIRKEENQKIKHTVHYSGMFRPIVQEILRDFVYVFDNKEYYVKVI